MNNPLDATRPIVARRRKAQAASSGITLLDMLLLLLLAVLAATVLVPWIGHLKSQYRTEFAADDVAAAFNEAHDLAVSRSRQVSVMVDEALRSVEVEGGSYRKLSAGVRLGGPPRNRQGKGMILFHPDGTSDGGHVVISGGEVAWVVWVDPQSGQPKQVQAGMR